ncbi:MAG: nucleotide sugar dehydrogenase [Promethearchaeota archaeon]
MNKKIQEILVSPDFTIKKVMEKINQASTSGAPEGIAFIVNDDKVLLGIVTDGDIRRAIIRGVHINQKVSDIMVKEPITVQESMSTETMLKQINIQVSNAIAKKRIKENKVDKVIIVDQVNKVIGISHFYEIWRKSDIKLKKICVIGMGFVGLTLAVSLSDIGFTVNGIDVDEETVNSIKKGDPHFHEKNLEYLLKRNINKSLFINKELTSNDNDVYIISVGTPIENNHLVNLDSIKNVSSMVGKFLKEGDLVIIRSTVPVRACRDVVLPILEKESSLIGGEDFYLAFAPERTVEGKALEELKTLPQIIGGFTKKCVDEASNFFRNLSPHIITVDSLEDAEMIKLINNSFRDVSFAFANELVFICDKFNLNAAKIIKAATEGYPRNKMALPGFVGGYCLRKDPYIYANSALKYDFVSKLVLNAREINENLLNYVAKKIHVFYSNNKKEKASSKIFIIGFAYKGVPETSDMRYSPTLDLIKLLKENSQRNIYGYDPVVQKEDVENTGVKYCSLEEGFTDADLVLIMNNHIQYKELDIVSLLKLTKKNCLFFDCWSMFEPKEILKVKGIVYQCLGYKS